MRSNIDTFRLAYGNSRNMMTPDVIRYGRKNGFVYEISQGEGFKREPIFGVSVATSEGERDHDKSAMFHSLADANTYVKRGFTPNQ